jgi:hypothetical protein
MTTNIENLRAALEVDPEAPSVPVDVTVKRSAVQSAVEMYDKAALEQPQLPPATAAAHAAMDNAVDE